MSESVWSVREALEQARAALPDAIFARSAGIERELIDRLNLALSSDDLSHTDLVRLLVEVKNALPLAWQKHGGCSGELLNFIDLTLQS